MALQRSEVLNERNAVVNDRDKWKTLIQNVCKVHNQRKKSSLRRTKRETSQMLTHNCNSLYMFVTVFCILIG